MILKEILINIRGTQSKKFVNGNIFMNFSNIIVFKIYLISISFEFDFKNMAEYQLRFGNPTLFSGYPE